VADDDGVYWLQNTLLQTLTEQQMMAIATSDADAVATARVSIAGALKERARGIGVRHSAFAS
jgi:hypothetical protein